MINDDLLPANHQACAILAALDTLQQAGIDAPLCALSIDADVYQIALPPARAIYGALAILQHAGIDAALDTGTPHQFRLMLKSAQETPAGKEDMRQAIQSALEYQWQVAVMDLTVSQAKGAR